MTSGGMGAALMDGETRLSITCLALTMFDSCCSGTSGRGVLGTSQHLSIVDEDGGCLEHEAADLLRSLITSTMSSSR